MLDFSLRLVADLTLLDEFFLCIAGDDAGDGIRATKTEAPSLKWVRDETRLANETSSLRDGANPVDLKNTIF